jgi:hypothetical protein
MATPHERVPKMFESMIDCVIAVAFFSLIYCAVTAVIRAFEHAFRSSRLRL